MKHHGRSLRTTWICVATLAILVLALLPGCTRPRPRLAVPEEEPSATPVAAVTEVASPAPATEVAVPLPATEAGTPELATETAIPPAEPATPALPTEAPLSPVAPATESPVPAAEGAEDIFVEPALTIGDQPDVVPGQVVVKLEPQPAMRALVAEPGADGIIATGVDNLDRLNQEFGVTGFDPLLEPIADASGVTVRSMAGRRPAIMGIYVVSYTNPVDPATVAAAYQAEPNVIYAEPNYYVYASETRAVPLAFTPNDPYFERQWNLQAIQAPQAWDISGGQGVIVAVVDSGVAYEDFEQYRRAPDLAQTTFVPGYDFVNDDTNPMDDHGHGTHVAGVIAAIKGNSEGIAGVSTGKVVAVKALTAQGWGTSFDIASAINYCANRSDVKVINMSLGSPYYSNLIESAVNYAVNTRLKLLVAAAGNSNSSSPHYPAYFAAYAQYANKVLAVAASGYWEYDPDYDYYYLNEDCRADYSNYGAWVSVAAPGTDIFSTLPWDKPFYMSWGPTRYGELSGTSMAAPFVAASAARRWGYKPLDSNAAIGAAVVESGDTLYTGGGCWPSSMAGKNFVNVAVLLDRGGAYAYAYDASNGNPLNGATVYLYRGSTLLGSGTITPYTYKASPTSTDPNRIYTYFYSWTDLINLPVGGWYLPKLYKSGYTASQQLAFQDWGSAWISGGDWTYLGEAYVPPRSSNFDVVLDWEDCWEYDFDVNVWLPNTPNPLDPGQPAPFIVGPEGDAFGYLEGDPAGAMVAFPYARYRYGFFDWPSMENLVIKKRYAHGIPANSYLPYYAGEYAVFVTDYGQTIDHDYDGCGDNYGWGYDPSYNPAADPDCPPNDPSGTLGWSLLRYVPWYDGPVSVFIWKDGVIKARTSLYGGECAATAHWWDAMRIYSTASSTATSPTYGYTGWCGSADIVSYSAEPFRGRFEIGR